MFTTGQMTGLILAIVLPIMVGVVPYYLFWKRSSKIESGMMGAFMYGLFGNIWQTIIYSFLSMLVLSVAYNNKDGMLAGFLNSTGVSGVFVAVLEALFHSVFVVLGLYWGVYLTNKKQRSLYRSATVGIGFGIAYPILVYGFPLYYVMKSSLGTITDSEIAKFEAQNLSVVSVYVSTYRHILMMIIFIGLALVMGNYYLQKDYLSSWVVPAIVYILIRFTDVILNTYLSKTVSKTIMCVLLTVLAAWSVKMILDWMKTDKVCIYQKKETL